MPDAPNTPQGHGHPSDLPELPGVTHRFVGLPSGLRMHVAEAGEREAPAVVLLHGFPQNWWEWRKVIPQLAERYRVIAPDLRGAGWTDAPAEGYTVNGMVADVVALLDALALPRVGLIAHDFSAFIGYRLCFDYPDRIGAYLCLGPHPYIRLGFKPQMLAGLAQLWFQPVVAAPGLGPWVLSGRALPHHLLSGFTDSISEEDTAVFTRRLHAPGHPEAGSALYRNLILPEMGRLVSGKYGQNRLTVPTVALLGSDDRAVLPDMLAVDGDRADDLTGHMVDGAAHFLADDRPDAVVQHALELFSRAL
ncbi:alpha/beta fold hydrolase [Sinomonas cellulolyticus]|nr:MULTISPECIES: alpha/beta hydrolase [Sinomonas]